MAGTFTARSLDRIAEERAAVAEVLAATKIGQDEHVRMCGNQCPHCQSRMVSAVSEFQVDGGEGWQAVACMDCGSEWTDLWKLTGYRLHMKGDK